MMRHEQAAPTVQTPIGDSLVTPDDTTSAPRHPLRRRPLGSTLVASTIGMLLALEMVVFALQNDAHQPYERSREEA